MSSPKLVYLSETEAATIARLLGAFIDQIDSKDRAKTQAYIDRTAAADLREKLEARMKGKK